MDSVIVVRLHTKKTSNIQKTHLGFEVILGSFWNPEAIKERSNFVRVFLKVPLGDCLLIWTANGSQK